MWRNLVLRSRRNHALNSRSVFFFSPKRWTLLQQRRRAVCGKVERRGKNYLTSIDHLMIPQLVLKKSVHRRRGVLCNARSCEGLYSNLYGVVSLGCSGSRCVFSWQFRLLKIVWKSLCWYRWRTSIIHILRQKLLFFLCLWFSLNRKNKFVRISIPDKAKKPTKSSIIRIGAQTTSLRRSHNGKIRILLNANDRDGESSRYLQVLIFGIHNVSARFLSRADRIM